MIQEKDFLYRVPVKTAPITTPGGQIRNPEILVDLEGGEFIHGNILDANSTNKLINQSVKDQENSLKTLIGAETSARTKGDEDLSSKIKAEQTRAEGKEKEISDKLAIVNGDSNTEGSFRKAIADVVAAAPEDLDTLKEIADKLAGNDDLHTALNQAITEKADASALLNEVTRATGVENNLKTAIDGKQPKGNYLTEHQSLEEYAKKTDIPEIDTSDFVSKTAIDAQSLKSNLSVSGRLDVVDNSKDDYSTAIRSGRIDIEGYGETSLLISNRTLYFSKNDAGIALDGDNNKLKIYFEAANKIMTVSHNGIRLETNSNDFVINENGFFVSRDSDDTHLCTFTPSGIRFEGKTASDIPTAGGGFIELSSLASAEDVSSLRVGLSKKQDKITVNTVDVTDIETADVTKLRTIVTNLINALTSSGLINTTDGVE